MSDVNKEIDSILENFNKKSEERAAEANKQREGHMARSERFKKLINDIIQPTMTTYVKYINSKGQKGQTAGFDLNRHFFDIAFEIRGTDGQAIGYVGALRFSQKDDKIAIVEEIRGSTKVRASRTEELCEDKDITEEFVKSKILSITKKFYDSYFQNY